MNLEAREYENTESKQKLKRPASSKDGGNFRGSRIIRYALIFEAFLLITEEIMPMEEAAVLLHIRGLF